MSLHVDCLAALRELIRLTTLPIGYNWRKCQKCRHFAKEIKFGEQFFKGRFCVRMVDWPAEFRTDLEWIATCRCFMLRERSPNGELYHYMRECAPMVIDSDRFF